MSHQHDNHFFSSAHLPFDCILEALVVNANGQVTTLIEPVPRATQQGRYLHHTALTGVQQDHHAVGYLQAYHSCLLLSAAPRSTQQYCDEIADLHGQLMF
jgi:hypothetical protein